LFRNCSSPRLAPSSLEVIAVRPVNNEIQWSILKQVTQINQKCPFQSFKR